MGFQIIIFLTHYKRSGFIDFDVDYTFYLPTQISTVCVIDRSDLPTVLFIFGCLNGHQYVFHGFEQNASQCITLHQNNGNVDDFFHSKIEIFLSD